MAIGGQGNPASRTGRRLRLKKFVFLTYGFETPTAEIMNAWGTWFESIKENVIERGHFPRGREISKNGVTELPLGPDSITGFVIVEAASFEDAERMAQSNPYITGIRLYEFKAG
jgi:hypothetical protein